MPTIVCEYEPESRLGFLGSTRFLPSLVSEPPWISVGVSGSVSVLPSFLVHWPLKLDFCEPETTPLMPGAPRLTVYVPSSFTPTFTFASSLPWPDVLDSDRNVPCMSCQVLPWSQEFLSVASELSVATCW